MMTSNLIKRMAVPATIVVGLLFTLVFFTFCDSEIRIPYTMLPEKARHFIENCFPTESVVYAEREVDDGCKEYEVKLSNGVEIEFYGDGTWKSLDCKFSYIPETVLPPAIIEDMAVRYPGIYAHKAVRKLGGYEITTSNGMESVYSGDGTFIRVKWD